MNSEEPRPRGPLVQVDRTSWKQPGRMDCPACAYKPDALGSVYGKTRAPETGDFSVCLNCGEVTIIEIHPLLGATLREATTAELKEFSRDQAATTMVAGVHEVARRRGDRKLYGL